MKAMKATRRTHLIAVLVGVIAISTFATDAAAYFHPKMGRFISRDPGAGSQNRVGASGVAAPTNNFIPRDPTGSNQYADGMNLYQYVKSAPMCYTDWKGLSGLHHHEPVLGENPDLRHMPEVMAAGIRRNDYWYNQRREELAASLGGYAAADKRLNDKFLKKNTVCEDWISDELKDMEWLKGLPDCPCCLQNADKNGGWSAPHDADQHYHPGADKCIRETIWHLHKGGQQCCYDKKGRLLTNRQELGLGTPDKIAPLPNVLGHLIADVAMYDYCRNKHGDAWVVQEYYKVRPPNNGKGCSNNP